MSEKRTLWNRTDCKVSENGPQCTLCCEIMAIQALQKEKLTKCQHQCESGCGIHGSHPAECQQFHCSDMSLNMWYFYYGYARDMGLITPEACAELRSKLLIS
jgi:hypothetical protein